MNCIYMGVKCTATTYCVNVINYFLICNNLTLIVISFHCFNLILAMFYSFFFSIFFPLHILCEANYGKLLDPDAAAIFQQRLTAITSTLETMPKQILKKYI